MPQCCGARAHYAFQGLQDAIGLSVVHPTWQPTRPGKDEHAGWAFASPDDEPFQTREGFGSFPPKDVIPDTVNHTKFVRDLYELTENDPGAFRTHLHISGHTALLAESVRFATNMGALHGAYATEHRRPVPLHDRSMHSAHIPLRCAGCSAFAQQPHDTLPHGRSLHSNLGSMWVLVQLDVGRC